MRKYKRVVVISDKHSGHIFGLTPPKYQGNDALAPIRAAYWNFYATTINALQPIDLLIVNADCIDGKGEKSKGTELLTSDRNEQAKMAEDSIKFAMARMVVMSYGTAYHTGDGEDWEEVIARHVNAERIDAHGAVDVNGLIIDYRHHVGSSSIPHGRATPISKERLWNFLQTEYDERQKADVIIRSHVHYHTFCGGRGWLALTTPALQGPGSKYGARRCSGTTDFGIVSFDVVSKTEYSWQAHILQSPPVKHSPLKV